MISSAPPHPAGTPGCPLRFLQGGGEMGRRIREHDWAATELGPPESWPGSLRTALRMMLTTQHPAFVFWGPQRRCFYNDSFNRSLGQGCHLQIFGAEGRRASESFWPAIGPCIESIMDGVDAAWHDSHPMRINRNGAPQDVHWACSCMPIDDDTVPSGVGGVFVVVTETAAATLNGDAGGQPGQPNAPPIDRAGPMNRHGALEPSDELFRAVFTQAAAGIAVSQAEPGGMLLHVNEALETMLGYGQGELTGSSFMALTHPEDRAASATDVCAALSGAINSFTLEKRYLHRNGQAVWTRAMISLVRSPDGEPRYFVASIADISDRKRAEHALQQLARREREKAEELAVLLDSVPVGVYIARDCECLHIEGNRSAHRILRIDSGQELSLTAPTKTRPVHFRALKDGRELRLDELPAQRSARGERVDDFEFTLAFEDGEVRHVLSSSTPLLDDAGRPRGSVTVMIDISDRKQSEEALRISEERFRLISTNSPDIVALQDRDLRYEWMVNPPLGWDPVETIGKTDRDLLDAEQFLTIRALKHAVMDSGKAMRLEMPLKNESGELRHYEGAYIPRRDANGEVTGLLGYFRDITERKRAYQALQASEQRMRLATEATHVGVWEWNTRTNAIYWNDEMFRIYGISPTPDGSVQYTDWSGAVLPNDLVGAEAVLRDTLHRRGHSRRSFRIRRRADGECRHIESVETVRTNDRGQVECVVGTNLDVTERVHAAQVAIDLNATLRRRLDEMQLILNVSPVGISIAEDVECRSVWNNPALRRLLRLPDEVGASTSAASGQPPPFRLMRHGVELPEHEQPMQRCLASGQAVIEDEVEVVLSDGATHHLLKSAVPLFDEAGGIRGCITFNMDVTERKRIEKELRENDRRKNEFLAILAHELRNPLAPVANAVHILNLKSPDIAELSWAKDVIGRQVKAMTRLIDDLLDVSRINQGKVQLKRAPIELAQVVQAAIETSRSLIDEQGHTLNLALPVGAVIVDGDATRLTQVFLNLLNNAAKYTPPGGRIDLQLQVMGSEAVVTVRDTGIGIPADKLSSIFDMFSQVEDALTRSQGGLGIGLNLAKRLAETHGGSIQASSGGMGLGSEFVVRLPVVTAAASPPETTSDGDDDIAGPKLRILVVDDNRDAADSLAMLLQMMGNAIHTAHDGEEAVSAAQAFRPHVVLCDIGLPKLNGYEACRQMKSQAWSDKMIFIALTGWAQEQDRRLAEEAGFNHHMVKPVDLRELTRLLNTSAVMQ